jgi:hypothetical protein
MIQSFSCWLGVDAFDLMHLPACSFGLNRKSTVTVNGQSSHAIGGDLQSCARPPAQSVYRRLANACGPEVGWPITLAFRKEGSIRQFGSLTLEVFGLRYISLALIDIGQGKK